MDSYEGNRKKAISKININEEAIYTVTTKMKLKIKKNIEISQRITVNNRKVKKRNWNRNRNENIMHLTFKGPTGIHTYNVVLIWVMDYKSYLKGHFKWMEKICHREVNKKGWFSTIFTHTCVQQCHNPLWFYVLKP